MSTFDINSQFVDHIVHIGTGLQDHLLSTLFDLLLGILVIRILGRLVRLLLKLTHIQTGLRYVLTSLFQAVLWVILAYTLLQEIGLGGIIYFFTGSIAAIGIAMAAGGSTLVADIIAAIFLAQDKDFNVGDKVRAGWDPVTVGVIERMDARRIRLRDSKGILHVIPNSLVERKEWVVLKRRAEVGAVTRATKTAKHIGIVALEKRAAYKAKKANSRRNEQ